MKKMSDKQFSEYKSNNDFFIKMNIHQKIGKKDLFSLISQTVAFQKGTSQVGILESMQTRENLKNTAFGYGIAFPHIILEQEVIPTLIICKLTRKIDEWKCPDNTAVNICLVLVISRKSKSNDQRIKRMTKIFRKFADKKFVIRISQCQTAQEIEKYL